MKTATIKMAKIQALKSSFKFRLGAMLAMSPVSETFHRPVKKPINARYTGNAVFTIDHIGYGMGDKF